MARRFNILPVVLAVILIAVVITYAMKMTERFDNPAIRPMTKCASDKDCTGGLTGGCFCANGTCGGGNDCGVKN
jgi:hypothetical protein